MSGNLLSLTRTIAVPTNGTILTATTYYRNQRNIELLANGTTDPQPLTYMPIERDGNFGATNGKNLLSIKLSKYKPQEF
jgi:hypothetical protein